MKNQSHKNPIKNTQIPERTLLDRKKIESNEKINEGDSGLEFTKLIRRLILNIRRNKKLNSETETTLQE